MYRQPRNYVFPDRKRWSINYPASNVKTKFERELPFFQTLEAADAIYSQALYSNNNVHE